MKPRRQQAVRVRLDAAGRVLWIAAPKAVKVEVVQPKRPR